MMNYLEYAGSPGAFSSTKQRAVLVSLSVPGYYSMPVRLLALLAKNDPEVSQRWDVKWAEWDIHDDLAACREALLQAEPVLVAFSVYVWNLRPVRRLSNMLKATHPAMRILCGGQEVTNSFVDFLRATDAWDYIIDGEGEIPFLQFLKGWDAARGDLACVDAVSGLRYRNADGLTRLTRPADTVEELGRLPSIILEGMVAANERSRLGVMLEGARGCNCRCTFCFEGYCTRKVRFSDVDSLEKEIRYMLDKGARQFHLLDPIVASHRAERTNKIMHIFNSLFRDNRELRLSVEAYAERMDDENCRVLGQPYVGLDLGLQSLNPRTLHAIRRPFRKDRFLRSLNNLNKTPAQTRIFLICGLPFETSTSFVAGVNEVLRMNADQVFLNELVVLNGTELRRQIAEHDWGYEYNPAPPYNMTSNRWISKRALEALYAMSTAMANWYNNTRMEALLFRSGTQKPHLDATEVRTVRFDGRKLYALEGDAGGWHELTDSCTAWVQGEKVMLQVEAETPKALRIAVNRLYFWGGARVTALVPQRYLTHEMAEAGLRLLRVEVERPETIASDLRAYARRAAETLRMHVCCVELLWMEDCPLPVDPLFYEQLSRVPFSTISILMAGGAAPKTDAFVRSLDAAHASKIWIRLPTGAAWCKPIVEHIWPSERDEMLRLLAVVDLIFDPVPPCGARGIP